MIGKRRIGGVGCSSFHAVISLLVADSTIEVNLQFVGDNFQGSDE